MSEAGEMVERLALIIKAMDDELSASQAREGELQEKLDGLTGEAAVLVSKLEAAEARIKASQEQNPVGYYNPQQVFSCDDFGVICRIENKREGQTYALYAHPPIPPELAELQRENAELQFKLQQVETNNLGMSDENAEFLKLLESKVPRVAACAC